ncbi:hypothetical protein FQZ97_1070120 [compost metagenome]
MGSDSAPSISMSMAILRRSASGSSPRGTMVPSWSWTPASLPSTYSGWSACCRSANAGCWVAAAAMGVAGAFSFFLRDCLAMKEDSKGGRTGRPGQGQAAATAFSKKKPRSGALISSFTDSPTRTRWPPRRPMFESAMEPEIRSPHCAVKPKVVPLRLSARRSR